MPAGPRSGAAVHRDLRFAEQGPSVPVAGADGPRDEAVERAVVGRCDVDRVVLRPVERGARRDVDHVYAGPRRAWRGPPRSRRRPRGHRARSGSRPAPGDRPPRRRPAPARRADVARARRCAAHLPGRGTTQRNRSARSRVSGAPRRVRRLRHHSASTAAARTTSAMTIAIVVPELPPPVEGAGFACRGCVSGTQRGSGGLHDAVGAASADNTFTPWLPSVPRAAGAAP